MDTRSSAVPSSARPWSIRIRNAALVGFAALAASILMTWPLAAGMGHLGRTQNSGDGRFAVWNVAWVAHALVTNPGGLYDANIFYPHRKALAFSEANIGAGALAVPVWAATHNPYAAHNSVVLFAFSASVVFTWLLVRRLTGDGGAAATSAVLFAFCPYLFSHTAHIQLLMAAGIPLSLLAFHRLGDAPTPARGAALGLALAAQAMSCAYYGVSAGLTVGYATIFYAWSRRLWTSRAFWTAIGIAAALSVGLVVPFFLPYLQIQQDAGFSRSLDDARQWSAYVRSYMASGANVHAWMLPLIRDWNNAVLFPGFVSIGLAIAGAWMVCRRAGTIEGTARLSRSRETALLYGSIALVTFWASLGPRAGLYTVLHETIPVFSFLRAPERMGVVVALCLAVLAAYAVRAFRERAPRHRAAIAAIACAVALFELNAIPFDWRPADPIASAYGTLARMPRGPVAEFPFYNRRIDFHLHTRYMLRSTVHWQPLVNGYSDHIPGEFRTLANTLATFPSKDAFDALKGHRVRYVTLSRAGYGHTTWPEAERLLQPYLPHLKRVADDGELVIYEVVSWPK
jgi:hypothetical protein